jgi:precorrin-6B methylase 1
MSGRLVVVGSGIQLGRHISERALGEIRAADRVFALTDAPTLQWLIGMRPDLENLGACYAHDRDRRDSYAEMQARILAPLQHGLRVCAVFYGHPGVYAQVPHRVISLAREAGHSAHMEPGISAEACLIADLGIDPGRHGLLSFETTQFLVRQHAVDPTALLLLWQVALCGQLDCTGFEPCPRRLQMLVDKLLRWYAAETPVILYEAAQLPIETFRAERIALAGLPQARFKEYTTLVIPPTQACADDAAMLARLRMLAEHDRTLPPAPPPGSHAR